MALQDKGKPSKSILATKLGDGDKPISRRVSSESLEFPPDNSRWFERRFQRRPPPFATRDQISREVETTGFFLCMCSIMLLSCAFGLLFITMWNIITKIPYIQLVQIVTYIGPNLFCFIAGIICIPCFWLTWLLHDHKKAPMFLPLLIISLCVGLVVLVIATSLGLAFRLNVSFYKTNNLSQLNEGAIKSYLNRTMSESIRQYDKNSDTKAHWDYIQRRLKCCGVKNASEWRSIRKHIPCSCRTSEIDLHFIYATGCLSAVALQLCWEIGFLTGMAILAILIKVATLVLASYMYGKEKCMVSRMQHRVIN